MSELHNFADCCMRTMRKLISALGPLASRYQNTLMLMCVGFVLVYLLCSIAFVGSVLAHVAMILLAITAVGMLVIDATNDYTIFLILGKYIPVMKLSRCVVNVWMATGYALYARSISTTIILSSMKSAFTVRNALQHM